MRFTLKKIILNSGMKQQFIAAKAGINDIRFSRIVHGHIDPNSEEKAAISQVLKTTISDLFPKKNK